MGKHLPVLNFRHQLANLASSYNDLGMLYITFGDRSLGLGGISLESDHWVFRENLGQGLR